MTELTKVYRTADGRFFEKDDRDTARAHDAWLELLAWVEDHDFGDSFTEPAKQLKNIAGTIAASPELIAILKRKPAEAPT